MEQIVNPDALNRLGVKKSYCFLKIDNYVSFKKDCRKLIKKNPQLGIDSFGVYGDYDLLFISYDRNFPTPDERLINRLWAIFGDQQYFESDMFGWFEIERILKIRGEIIIGREYKVFEPSFEIEKYLPDLRRIMLNDHLDKKTLDELNHRKLCFNIDFSKSDKLPMEDELSEFLVLISLTKERENQRDDPCDLFEKEILLPNLLLDRRIRTIEKIGSGSLNYHFLLHVIGNDNDLAKVVIEEIHHAAHSIKGLNVKTRLILPAEKITVTNLPGLMEYDVPKVESSILFEAISQYRILVKPQKFTFPFAIYYLEEVDRRNLSAIYQIYGNLVYKYFEKDESLINVMVRFIVKIAEIMASDNENQISICKEFEGEGGIGFIRILNNQIEGSLQKIFKYSVEKLQLTNSDFTEIVNWAIETKFNKKGHFDLKKLQIGDAIFVIRALDGFFKNQDPIQKIKKKYHLVNDEKIILLQKIYETVRFFFEPTFDSYKNSVGMRQTITNLSEFSINARNISEHEPGEGNWNESIQHMCSSIKTITNGVHLGVRYLSHVFEKFEKMATERMEEKFAPGYSYQVALSFAGEDREYAERLAKCLKKHRVRFFYDKHEEAELWGKDLFEHLAWIYKDAAQYCAMFVSKNYAKKLWTTHERKNAQARAFKGQEDYILPIRLDDTEIPGMPETIGYVDLRSTTIEDVCNLLLKKLGLV